MKAAIRFIWKAFLFYWPNRKWINSTVKNIIDYVKKLVRNIKAKRSKSKPLASNKAISKQEKKSLFINENNYDMSEKKEGIDLIKKAIKTLIDTGEEIAEAKSNDGKISKIELIGLGDNVIAIGSQAMKINKIISQAKDIDTEEGKELAMYIVDELGFKNEDVQFVLTHTFAYIQDQLDAYNEHLKPIIEKIKEMRNK